MTVVRAEERRTKLARRPSSFALKLVMAITGVVFVGFVFVHMIGNLKVYAGADAFDHYAHWLREIGYPLVPKYGVLWALRATLAACLVGHVAAAVALWARGRASRGRHRRGRLLGYSGYAARTMLLGGVILLAFVIVHLLDLTIGAGLATASYRHPDADGTIHAYANLVASFSRPWMAVFYSVVMVVLAVHVEHGVRTLAQDLGATGRRLRAIWAAVGGLIAVAVLLGNALIPPLVLAGVIA